MHASSLTLAALTVLVAATFGSEAEACGGGGGGYRVVRHYQSTWHPRVARVAPPSHQTAAVASADKQQEAPFKAVSQSENSSIAVRLADAAPQEPTRTATTDTTAFKATGCTRYFPAIGVALNVACER